MIFLHLTKKLRFFHCSLLVVLAVTACRDNPARPEESVQDFQIDADTFSTYSSAAIQLRAVVTNSDGSEKEVTSETIWTISPGTSALINQAGRVSTVNNLTGVETVTAEYQSKSVSVQVEVTRRADILGLWPVVTNIQAGEALQFRCAATFQDDQEAWVTDDVSWSIAPGLAASIDQHGRLTSQAGAAGVETVTVSYHGWSAESEVEVQAAHQNRFEMARIPAGPFTMGSDSGEADESPAHEVDVDAFEIGKFEITNVQYAEFLTLALQRGHIRYNGHLVSKNTPPFRHVMFTKIPDFDRVEQFLQHVPGDGTDPGEFVSTPGFENHPVLFQTWYGAHAFAEFYGLKLPSEAEWEKAARGGLQLEYATADGSISHDLANIAGTGGRDSFAEVAPVGLFPPNAYGVHDLSGNVREFVRDFYANDFYARSPADNPFGPHDILDIFGRRIRADWLLRGGSWREGPSASRCANRILLVEPHDNVVVTAWDGFRVARDLAN